MRAYEAPVGRVDNADGAPVACEHCDRDATFYVVLYGDSGMIYTCHGHLVHAVTVATEDDAPSHPVWRRDPETGRMRSVP